MKLNHVLVNAHDADAMQQFFTDVIGLESGYRPPFPFKGAWLYSEGQALIHLAESNQANARTGNDVDAKPDVNKDRRTGALIDHIALEGADFDDLMARLEKHGNQYSARTVPDTGRRQIFVIGPEGIRIEMQFPPAD